MRDLIEALTIFLKYGDPHHPTHCEHDELRVMIEPELVGADDIARLRELSFVPDFECGFRSSRFGSC